MHMVGFGMNVGIVEVGTHLQVSGMLSASSPGDVGSGPSPCRVGLGATWLKKAIYPINLDVLAPLLRHSPKKEKGIYL